MYPTREGGWTEAAPFGWPKPGPETAPDLPKAASMRARLDALAASSLHLKLDFAFGGPETAADLVLALDFALVEEALAGDFASARRTGSAELAGWQNFAMLICPSKPISTVPVRSRLAGGGRGGGADFTAVAQVACLFASGRPEAAQGDCLSKVSVPVVVPWPLPRPRGDEEAKAEAEAGAVAEAEAGAGAGAAAADAASDRDSDSHTAALWTFAVRMHA